MWRMILHFHGMLWEKTIGLIYMENGLFFTFTLRLIYMENDSSSRAYLDLFTWNMILLHTHALDVDINQGFTFWNSTKSHPFA
jgi:hypothetical protein